MTSTCYGCGRDLPTSAFVPDRHKPSGRKSICRDCDNAKSRRYYAENRERALGVRLSYYARQQALKPPPVCKMCGGETPTRRHAYCDECRAARKRDRVQIRDHDRARAHRARYGTEHKKTRKRWARVIAEEPVACARCGEWIGDESWDLDHDDADSSRYLGPSHSRCNRATAGRLAPPVTSREW